MNTERLTALRNYLENPPVDYEYGFNMLGWSEDSGPRYRDLLNKSAPPEQDCGTVCCIAGLAIALYPDCSKKIKFCDQGAEILGLTHSQARDLFYGGHIQLDNITVDMAIAVIDGLIETGAITWRYPGVILQERYNDLV